MNKLIKYTLSLLLAMIVPTYLFALITHEQSEENDTTNYTIHCPADQE